MSGRHEEENEVNVQVLLRCRTLSDEELRSNAREVITCNDNREVTVSGSIDGKHTIGSTLLTRCLVLRQSKRADCGR